MDAVQEGGRSRAQELDGTDADGVSGFDELESGGWG